MLHLPRSLDKGQKFVNGAIDDVFAILDDCVFILRLSSGTLVLVHSISIGGRTVLPCSCGYATTIRKGAWLCSEFLAFNTLPRAVEDGSDGWAAELAADLPMYVPGEPPDLWIRFHTRKGGSPL